MFILQLRTKNTKEWDMVMDEYDAPELFDNKKQVEEFMEINPDVVEGKEYKVEYVGHAVGKPTDNVITKEDFEYHG